MLDKDVLLSITKQYYVWWKNKDIDHIRTIFSEDIILIDPIIKVEGLSLVVKANEDIFKGCEKIEILREVVFVDHYSDTTIAEVKFLYDEKVIEVVDIFSFDESGKIKKIVAYLDTK